MAVLQAKQIGTDIENVDYRHIGDRIEISGHRFVVPTFYCCVQFDCVYTGEVIKLFVSANHRYRCHIYPCVYNNDDNESEFV